MKLGVTLPLSDIGGGPAMVRLFANAAEAAGYDHLAAPTMFLGVNVASSRGWGRETPRPIFSTILSSCSGSRRTTRFGFSNTRAHPAPAANRAGRQAAACLNDLSGG
jgi:hypothetical protein